MSGLRFESMADMPQGMRALYARQECAKMARNVQREVLQQTQSKPEKYHAIRTECAGIKFRSKKEARRYEDLMQMLQEGVIRKLKLQPQFTLQESFMTETGARVRAIRYTADYSYEIQDAKAFGGWRYVVEDVKSTATRTKEYLRNKKMMREKFGIDITEV